MSLRVKILTVTLLVGLVGFWVFDTYFSRPNKTVTTTTGKTVDVKSVVLEPQKYDVKSPNRDPFKFEARDTIKQGGLNLQGFMGNNQAQLVVINDEVLGLGDAIEGWEVVEIMQNRVILKKGKAQQILRVSK